MPEEKENSAGNTPFDLFLKLWPVLWPVLLITVGLIFGYGKKDSKADWLSTQNGQLETKIDGLSVQISKLAERLATLEGEYKSDKEDRQQQELYRQRIGK